LKAHPLISGLAVPYSADAEKYWIGSTHDTEEDTTQHITEYNINKDIFSTTQVGTIFQKDDHNQVQILIRQCKLASK